MFKLGICFSAISFEVYIQKNYTCELSIYFVADRCQCTEVSLESQFFFVRLMVISILSSCTYASPGACHTDLLELMEAEHCSKAGCNFEFKTTNKEIETCPMKEWKIIMRQMDCPDRDMKFNRRVLDIEELRRLPISKGSGLT